MLHPLVQQLHFTRKKWLVGLQDVTPEEAIKRFEPMNCISWIIGHLAFQEQLFWCILAQNEEVLPSIAKYGWGEPASTPPLDEVWSAWRQITQKADVFLSTVNNDNITLPLVHKLNPDGLSLGTHLHRNIHHYWFHLGESQAIRQLLGHTNLPNFVGNIAGGEYVPERPPE